MISLALPAYDHKITEIDGKKCIYDPIRKKNIVLTPEEWVRQHFMNLLLKHLQYSKNLIKIETGTYYGEMDKRTDILTYDRNGQPYLLVECKAPSIKLDNRTLTQATVYNKTIKAPFLAITNGLKTFCFEVNWESKTTKQLKDLPAPF